MERHANSTPAARVLQLLPQPAPSLLSQAAPLILDRPRQSLNSGAAA